MSNFSRRWVGKVSCVCVGAIVAFIASGGLAQAQTQLQSQPQVKAPAALETTLKNMLTALQTNSLPYFIADGDAALKSGMTPQMFAGVSAQFGPRLAHGYTATFLGMLNQQGYTVYVWKLVFKDARDDLLAIMAVRDGKVGGFVLQ